MKYINDILKLDLDGTLIQTFADDIIVLINEKASYRFTKSVNRQLSKVGNWIRENKLILNHDKCQYIMIYKGKRITHIPTIKINNKNIKHVKQLKYLGVVFDQKLNGVTHAKAMKDKVSNFQGKLNRLTRATWGLKGKFSRKFIIQ